MPIPWLVVLQSAPWTEVIKNAPKVAEGAKKLWSTLGKKPSSGEVELSGGQSTAAPESLSVAEIQIRLVAVEATATELHEQMLVSSELIKSLAEQNTQLIRHIELNRVRMLWLTGGVILSGIACLLLLMR